VQKPSAYLILTAGLIALATLLRVADPGPIARMRTAVFDTFQRLAPRPFNEATPVMVVDIDDASLKELGQWPWPRTRLAGIVDRLTEGGAQSIALDIVLAEPDRYSPSELARQLGSVGTLAELVAQAGKLPDNDATLGDAVGRGPVVLGVSGEPRPTGRDMPKPKAAFANSGDDPIQFIPAYPGGTPSLANLTSKARGLGAVNWVPSRDQIVRHVPLLVAIDGTLFPTLSLEQLRVAEGASTVLVRASGGSGITAFGQKTGIDSLRVGTKTLNSDPDGQLWLHFRRYDRATYVSAASVLNGSLSNEKISGRHFLLGASATGLLDLRATPLDPAVPGVEIHAQALEQMFAGGGLIRPAWATGAEIVFLIVGGALMAWLIKRAGPVRAALTGVAAITTILAGSWLAFRGSGLMLDPVFPSLAVMTLYLAGSLYTYIKTEADRQRVRSAFGYYVSAPVVDQLAADPGKLKLGGETRDITVLIADVRGFSSLSEGMEAHEVIAFVNKVFTPLSDIILEENGTIDKFMGDAVMAFWNAPVRDPKHAEHATRAAHRMLTKLEQLNQDWAAEADAEGRTHKTVRMGIGVNTGACAVGNVGSPQRFDYSILGDPVNAAARLEELTKSYGVPIIAGPDTAAGAAAMALMPLGSAALRGKDNRIDAFAVLGDETTAASAQFADLKHQHANLLAALDKKDRKAAMLALEKGRAINWPGLDRLFERHRDVIEAL
jgi:adenylate cyclase